MSRVLLITLLLALTTIGTGCVREPSMALHGARLQTIDGRGLAVELNMKVKNPNSFDVQLRNVRADVTLANRFRLPRVTVSPNQWLRAGETTEVRVPVRVPFEMVLPLLQTTATSPEISYRAVGTADVSATSTFEIDVDDYEIDREGSLSREALVAAALRGGFKVTSH